MKESNVKSLITTKANSFWRYLQTMVIPQKTAYFAIYFDGFSIPHCIFKMEIDAIKYKQFLEKDSFVNMKIINIKVNDQR